jgi:hypothetical protein
MVSSFMDEFISFDGKRNEPKKSRPYSVGLRLLCALQLSALIRSKPPVLDNKKGGG